MSPNIVPKKLRAAKGTETELQPTGSWPRSRHLFEDDSLEAVESAWAAGRPLLIRGEPGIGKSQFARAVAQVLNRPFLSFVVNSAVECCDLLYSYDPVSRLAQAQVLAGRRQSGEKSGEESGETWETDIAEIRFVRPRALWWAFDWKSASGQARQYYVPEKPPVRPKGWKIGDGCVVLIDEIDKADSDLPNGLLESLGNTGFDVPPARQFVALPETAQAPLVLITTNEERELPAAFLRRCFVLHMPFPKDPQEQKALLIGRGRAQYRTEISDEAVYLEAANQLLLDRQAVPYGQPKPGAAEYLDLLKALAKLCPGNTEAQLTKLKTIRRFVFHKHIDDPTS